MRISEPNGQFAHNPLLKGNLCVSLVCCLVSLTGLLHVYPADFGFYHIWRIQYALFPKYVFIQFKVHSIHLNFILFITKQIYIFIYTLQNDDLSFKDLKYTQHSK